jgi:hypothetical protein
MTLSAITVPHVSPMMVAAVALGLLGLAQLVLLWRLARSSKVAADALARVERLTAALELLTDTTEEGFVNVATELERLGAKPVAAPSTRRATTRRIVTAARKGRSVDEIAAAESISESEVRLHLGLESARAADADAEPVAETPAPAAGVLDDLERWMRSLGPSRRARGARHAAVRV